MAVPTRLVRLTEFLFRRADASGDVYPDDADHGVVPGPDPDRVLFLGEAGMITLGVRTHDLSLAAFFARHHHAATRRGVEWRVRTLPSSRIAEGPRVTAAMEAELRRTDLVVLVVGITDALRVISGANWEESVRSTLRALISSLPRDARILVAEIPPLDNAGTLSRPARIAAGLQAQALNRRTREAAEEHERCRAVAFPDELTRSLWRPDSEENRYTHTYTTWARRLAEEARS
jgi:hypothetical protein